MDKDTKEVRKTMFMTKTVYKMKMKDNEIQSTTKSYCQKSAPYRFKRFRPGQNQSTADTSSNSHPKVENMEVLLKELSNLTSTAKTPQKMNNESIYSARELYRQKSSLYKWKRDRPEKRHTNIKRYYDRPKNVHTIKKQDGAEKNQTTIKIMDYGELCKQNSSETGQSSK